MRTSLNKDQTIKYVKKETLWHRIKKNKTAYAYILPSTLVVIIFSLIPILYGVSLAFTNSNIYTMSSNSVKFVGLKNFIKIFKGMDQEFVTILLRTIVWTIVNVFFHVSIGLSLALLLNKKGLRFKKLYRILLILPWAVPQLVTCLIWKIMFNYDIGMINQILTKIGLAKVPWLNDPKMAFVAIIMVNVWLGVPFMMMVATGALQSISDNFYEAANIEGASWWQKFRYITLPMIKPAMVPAITLGFIWTFTNFNVAYLVTKGEPNRATELIQTYTYNQMTAGNYSKAAAYGVIVFAILFILNLISTKINNIFEEDN
ncbi:carbohydrate ABC transporter permease [Clostridium brassicae]|uniref:Sugar ABC transporter permease n=1 Tax=Clostridium brassicae TaxID=2999072 RepID=A0ABT4D8L4_9CLOT|nr:sugar ABC transporter permease [Clostridium brassicae]MCY6958644.1 sugar ABC transporter permease [Clostridium brassicae]